MSSRTEIETTIEGVLTENTQKEVDSDLVASNGKERESASAQKQKKDEGNALILDMMLSSLGRRP